MAKNEFSNTWGKLKLGHRYPSLRSRKTWGDLESEIQNQKGGMILLRCVNKDIRV